MTTTTRCRALVAGFGRPGMRDLDFGRQLVRYLEEMSWPEDVVIEDLSYAAPLVLHRLQELEPAQVVLVGASARGFEAPGAVRSYRIHPEGPPPGEVQRSIEESLQGLVDIDHTLAVARHWGALPPETFVIEVEPADCSFGLGFSEDLASVFDQVLDLVLEQVGRVATAPDFTDLDAVASEVGESASAVPVVDDSAASDGLDALVQFAGHHRAMRSVHSRRGGLLLDVAVPGVSVASRSLPWGANADAGSDWCDVIPLEDGWVGLVIGEAPGRGIAAAPAMADVRIALRAIAVGDGLSPARVLERLDRLAKVAETGHGATVLYAALNPSTGELRLSNAGHCPPLLLAAGRNPDPLRMARAGAVGASSEGRPEATLRLAPGTTVLLHTDGLGPDVTAADDGAQLRQAHVRSNSVDDLCDHLLEAYNRGLCRDDDISVLAARLSPISA